MAVSEYACSEPVICKRLLQCESAQWYSAEFLHLVDRLQQVMGPQLYSAMSNRTEVAKGVCVGDGGRQPARDSLTTRRMKRSQEMRRPRPYCLVVPEEPLRYPLQPRICNVIMVAAEIRCSHAWPAGVNQSLLVEHIMPKIDSAATVHIVWSEKFFDDYSILTESATAAWGCKSNTARVVGKETLVLSTWLPDGPRSQLVLRDVLYMPDLRINHFSVPQLLAAGENYEVFFSGGA